MKNALDTIQELSNLIQFSPKRPDFFEWMRLSFDLTGGALRPLCSTRWTAKAKSFEWVLHNYDAMLEILLSTVIGNDGVTCLEVETKASEIHEKLDTFDLFLVIAVYTKFYLEC